MGKNEYDNFESFYNEYSRDRDIFNGSYTGLDFKYNNVIYRLSHEYSNESDELYKYYTYIIEIKPNDAYFNGNYVLIGKYTSLDELVNKWIIDGQSFKDIIVNEKTEILGKD